jgi:hypothetical protein
MQSVYDREEDRSRRRATARERDKLKGALRRARE